MAFWLLLGAFCILGALAVLAFPLVCTRLGSQRCASCWTRSSGGGRVGRYLCYPGEFAGQHKILLVKFMRGFVVFMISSCTC